ncbi:unnamed protein product [Penicillium salamii]|nr:unnamed protein product [Penicillium salamii]CAG8131691.1 unnamed protein product [Penicillium salamii]CAG8363381.1 unnamed protein product [Penicillium salamii]
MAKDTSTDQQRIKTRFLICSDTHGMGSLPGLTRSANQHADVVIHCGDLTTGSQIDEFKAAIRLLEAIDAPLKLVIARNHDFTMDIPIFRQKVEEAHLPDDQELIEKTYGFYKEARSLFKNTGITFLDEGIHSLNLQNGALLTVYASPYTPSLGDWGFQYRPDDGHDFAINNSGSPCSVDVVMTHGPPRGIMDYTLSGKRAGSIDLFRALALANPRPQMHCFGHIHEGWGAKLITWREKTTSAPSHLTDIDNGRSHLISKLSMLREDDERSFSARGTHVKCFATSHCSGDTHPLNRGSQTLFVNAAIEGPPQAMNSEQSNLSTQPPWIVDLELQASPRGATLFVS